MSRGPFDRSTLPPAPVKASVMLAEIKRLLICYSRAATEPLKVGIANRLADEVRVLESLEGDRG